MVDINFNIYEESLLFHINEEDNISFYIEDGSIINFGYSEEIVNFFIDKDDLIFNTIEETINFEIDYLCTGPPGIGSGYNFLNITSPTDGIDVGQDTNVTIIGTTMRCSGADTAVPIVTVDGVEVNATPMSEDQNIYQFSKEVDLIGGENEIIVESDNLSQVVTAMVNVTRDATIDITPPVTTHSISGTITDGWYTTLPEITLTATDTETGVNSTYYRINGGSWQTYSALITVSTQENVTFEYYSEDQNGNTEDINSVLWKTDTQAPTSNLSATGTHYSGDWYRSDVTIFITASDTSSVDQTFIGIDGGAFTEDTSHVFTTDGLHTVQYYSTDILGHTETTKTKNINIDTTPVNIANIILDNNDWYYGDGAVTYTVECSEDTSGWTGSIDLSAFGHSSSYSLSTSGTTLYATFTPAKQDAMNTPNIQVWDKGGNTDTEVGPQLTTHEYRVAPEDLYFPAFSDTSNALSDGKTFTNDNNVEAEWGTDYSRSGTLVNGTDFNVVDSNKIQLTSIWQDDIESNSLGNMYITVWED